MDSVSADIENASDDDGNSGGGDELLQEEVSKVEEILVESSSTVEGVSAEMNESWSDQGGLENVAEDEAAVNYNVEEAEDYQDEQPQLQENANLEEKDFQGSFEHEEETGNNQKPDSFDVEHGEEFDQHDYTEQDNVTEEIEVPVQEELVLEEEQQEDLSPGEDVAAAYSPDIGENEELTEKSDREVSVHDKMENGSEIVTDEKNEESEDDFDNVVEVEELKDGSGAEDDNTAQHISDSEDDEEGKPEEFKLGDESEDDLAGASSGSEKTGDAKEDHVSPTKSRNRILSDEDDDSEEDNVTREKHEAAMKMFDSDSEEEKEGVGDLIADIFGESDDEGEEFTGFGSEEVKTKKSTEVAAVKSDSEEDNNEWKSAREYKKAKIQEEDDSDEGVQDSGTQGMSDFDIMLAKKKEENRRHRKRRDNSTFISDADDIINAMLTKMKEAAESDREANLQRRPALKKLKMLPSVISHLKKQNLKELFVDNGVIAAIADWLSLLPDRSLPHITIRTELLQVLHDLPSVGPETLKHSGIGKAVMILFKHPKESRQNKDSAGRLINKWSRPIFGLNENFKSMSREEREQRDLEQMPQAKRRKLTGASQGDHGEEGKGESELGHLRPGEAGFVMRARVPMPSTKDYVVRPKWNVEVDDRDDEESDAPKAIARRRRSAGAPRSSKKDERLEKHIRNFAEKKKNSKMQRAVKISIEGNKMSIL